LPTTCKFPVFQKGNFLRKLTNLFKKRHYFYAFYRSKNHKTKNWDIVSCPTTTMPYYYYALLLLCPTTTIDKNKKNIYNNVKVEK